MLPSADFLFLTLVANPWLTSILSYFMGELIVQRVLRVNSATVTIWRSVPPSLTVSAIGQCSSSGWAAPTLAAWRYLVPPEDGIQDFDFLAVPPSGFALTVITPIAASELAQVSWANYWGPGKALNGVRIHAQENSVEASAGPEVELLAERGGGNPWPWRTTNASVLKAELIGKKIRVYQTGDALNKDLHLDRCNVELDPSSSRVVDVWFG